MCVGLVLVFVGISGWLNTSMSSGRQLCGDVVSEGTRAQGLKEETTFVSPWELKGKTQLLNGEEE